MLEIRRPTPGSEAGAEWLVDGKPVDVKAFKDFYTNAMSLQADAFHDEPVSGKAEVTFEFALNAGSVRAWTVGFVPHGQEFYAVVKNGTSDMLVNRQQLKAVLGWLEELAGQRRYSVAPVLLRGEPGVLGPPGQGEAVQGIPRLDGQHGQLAREAPDQLRRGGRRELPEVGHRGRQAPGEAAQVADGSHVTSGARLIAVSVKTSASSVLRVENSDTTAPSGPPWNQCSVSGIRVYWSPGRSTISCRTE